MRRPAPGQVWSGRFELISEIGRGASGQVWLAEDRQTRTRVAVKILDPTLAGLPDAVALLQEECRKAGTLRHPNIVRVDGFFADEDGYFISMPWVDGRPLTQWCDRSVAAVMECALALCDAIEHAHLAGIIHRDLKPANVLRDGSGRFYLTDFGIAGGGTAIEPRGGGSLPYMSPQQLDGAPASIADDIYGLGALLHELLSGAPPFHPAPTPHRVRTEKPQPLTVDSAGQDIPPALSALILAMLAKDPARRPAGIGAVRSALTEIDRAEPAAVTIRPQRRNGAAELTEAGVAPAPIRPERQGLSPTVVLAALAVLVAVAAGVIFALPTFVAERGRPVTETPAVQASEPTIDPGADTRADTGPAVDPATLAAQRRRADEALGEVLAIDERLRAMGVDLWGGDDWSSARAFAAAGDNAYRQREFVTALGEHRRALELMRLLESRAPEVFARSLADGEQALLDRDQPSAIAHFEVALAIEPTRPEAQRGLERALRLDRVLDIMGRAIAAESAGDWTVAGALFEEALALDPDWQPAADGAERMRAESARLDFEKQMAAGFDALRREAFVPARRAFETALAMRPGDPAAREALRQVDADARLRKITALRASARAAEAEEQWTTAAQLYVDVLATDPKIDAVRADLARVRARAQLDEDLDRAIGAADRFYEDPVATRAAAVLAEARTIESPGPVLAGKLQRLDTLLRVAARPVPVRFRSDNLTDVVIFKVGRLGTFTARTLDLRPGAYVAVGTRDGYRDVRRAFRVTADGPMPPVVLRCEEPI